MSDVVERELRDGIALLRINRPEKRNAFNHELSLAVAQAMEAFEADDDVRAVILTGTGEAFSAGADMTETLASVEGGKGNVQMAQAVVRVARFPKPIIAAVNGFAFGGGAVLAVGCDIRIASERASFRFPGASYGLVIAASQLARIVGLAKAKELVLTARVIEAKEAERIGLVNRTVPHDALDDAAREMALQIAQNSPAAVRWSKAVIDAATTVERGEELEMEANRALRGTPDNVERFRDATERVAGRGNAE